jgi:serine/threonine protein phosphatase 1
MSDQVYYAIGDIHGEAARLAELHRLIDEDAARAAAPFRIVHVGDLIDRGPHSRSVVERVMAMHRERGEQVITLRGNHEQLMLHAYDREETIGLYHWATNGGDETILSYETANGAKDHWREAIDRDHVSWMRTLPTIWRDETRGLVFVHGGIDPHMFPNCEDGVRLWTRSRSFFESERWPNRAELRDILVVHGHTPTDDFEPEVQRRRINVDTGACFGGPLTCVVLAPGEAPRFLYA